MEILNYKDEHDFFEYLRESIYIPHKIDYSYVEFEIPKRNGGIRKISAPNPILKNIQKYIASSFLEDIHFRSCVHASFFLHRCLST